MSLVPGTRDWAADLDIMNQRGKWAIITGASSGIGKALAFEFAAGGCNVLLVARNEAALTQVAVECRSRHGVDAEVFAADLSCADSLNRLVDAITQGSRQYDALVNNAGFGIHGDFASTDIQQNIELLNLQLTAALRLTRALLPGMISRHSGRILNVASVYSFSPVPLQSVYAACKAFLLSFSSALQNEVKGTGVTVTVFCPGITQTEFRARAGIREKSKHSGMTSEAAAHIAYVETQRGKHIVVPGLVNRLFVFLSHILPFQAVPSFIRLVNRRRGQNHS
jgi:short-subunit dehydrogenase